MNGQTQNPNPTPNTLGNLLESLRFSMQNPLSRDANATRTANPSASMRPPNMAPMNPGVPTTQNGVGQFMHLLSILQQKKK